MLPETQSGRETYIELRDCRNRWRGMAMRRFAGDLEAFRGWVLDGLIHDAELGELREAVDFAEAEGMLTPEQLEAANNAVAWGECLRHLIQPTTATTGAV